MKILELNFEKGWRGGESQTLYNMIGFRQSNFNVHLVCRKGSPLEKNALNEKFTVHSFATVFGVLFYLLFNSRKYTIIHAQTSHILTYCVLAKPFNKTKLIFTRRVNFKPKGFFTKKKYELADRVVAISNAVKNTIFDFTGRTDIEIISDIVDNKRPDTDSAGKKLTSILPPDKIIIATVSSLANEKNPLGIVEAIKILKEQRSDFVFLHFGSGPLQKEMESEITKYNLQETYILKGFVDNVTDYFSAFDVFVMNSNNEGLCSSVLDAFIHKVPVVSTNAGGLSDLIGNDRAVFTEINHPIMLADGIRLLMSDSKKKELVVNNAYQYVISNHSMSVITGKYIALFKQIISKH